MQKKKDKESGTTEKNKEIDELHLALQKKDAELAAGTIPCAKRRHSSSNGSCTEPYSEHVSRPFPLLTIFYSKAITRRSGGYGSTQARAGG